MNAHAVTLDVELRRSGEAIQRADSFDPERIPSLPRRSRHLIEVSRAYYQRRDHRATYVMLDSAERTASETIRFNGYARDMLLSLADSPPTGMRAQVRDLAERVGLRL